MIINVLFGCSCQEMVKVINQCTLACYNCFGKLGKPCLLNCPLQCIDTPKSQYCITILNENIDILIYRRVSHITRLYTRL